MRKYFLVSFMLMLFLSTLLSGELDKRYTPTREEWLILTVDQMADLMRDKFYIKNYFEYNDEVFVSNWHFKDPNPSSGQISRAKNDFLYYLLNTSDMFSLYKWAENIKFTGHVTAETHEGTTAVYEFKQTDFEKLFIRNVK